MAWTGKEVIVGRGWGVRDTVRDGGNGAMDRGGDADEGPKPSGIVSLSERLALSVDEAGALLGISRDLAYDLVARREIPSVRLGRRLVVPRRALEEVLERLLEAG